MMQNQSLIMQQQQLEMNQPQFAVQQQQQQQLQQQQPQLLVQQLQQQPQFVIQQPHQQQPNMQQGPQMFVYPQPAPVNTQFAGQTAIKLGATQIILGILCVVTNLITLCLDLSDSYPSTSLVLSGVWAGTVVIIAGAFGVKAGKKQTNCLIVAFMVLSMVSALGAMAMLLQGIMGVTWANKEYYYYFYVGERTSLTVFNTILVLLAVAELVIAIISSVLGCRATCNNKQPMNGVQYINPGSQPMYMMSAAPPSGQLGCVVASQPLLVPMQGVQNLQPRGQIQQTAPEPNGSMVQQTAAPMEPQRPPPTYVAWESQPQMGIVVPETKHLIQNDKQQATK